jgi:hypothetical protein
VHAVAAMVGDAPSAPHQPPPHPPRRKASTPLPQPLDERPCPIVVVLGLWMLLVGAALRCGRAAAVVVRTTDSGHASTSWVHFPLDRQPQQHAWTVQVVPPGAAFPRGAHWLRVSSSTTTPPCTNTTRPPIRLVVPATGSLATTSLQARTHHCPAAVNGGPFHADGSSVGVLVVDGSLVKDDTLGPSVVGFGVTRPRRRYTRRGNGRHDVLDDDSNNNTKATNHLASWVLGTPPSQAVLADLEWFVTGFDWLVREGVNVAQDDATGAHRAARTAVGIAGHDGSLVLLVVDGCERW